MARCLTLAAILVVAFVASRGAQALGQPAADLRQIEAFLIELQRVSHGDDREAIAALIRYPVTITIGGFRVPFANAASVVSRYDDISTRGCERLSPAHRFGHSQTAGR
jgi:hypothetical protein